MLSYNFCVGKRVAKDSLKRCGKNLSAHQQMSGEGKCELLPPNGILLKLKKKEIHPFPTTRNTGS
jgi:hypothetical protein